MGTDKKKGRPFTGNEPLSHDMKVRVSETTYRKLKQYGDRNGITVAESARQAIQSFVDKE